MKIRATAAPWYSGVCILISDGDVGRAEPLTFKKVEPGSIAEPTATIDYAAAQLLMDDLWAAGLRPTEGAGSAGSLLATERHLSDMRAIVAKKLGINL